MRLWHLKLRVIGLATEGLKHFEQVLGYVIRVQLDFWLVRHLGFGLPEL